MSEKDKKTLSAEDIITERKIGRRSTLRAIGATMVGAAVVSVVGTAPSTAEAKASDSDSGAGSDPAGHGRTGRTDRDSGPNADGPGRGVCAERGHTDSDTGGSGDAPGRGRGPCHN